jgi:hypothetical protein
MCLQYDITNLIFEVQSTKVKAAPDALPEQGKWRKGNEENEKDDGACYGRMHGIRTGSMRRIFIRRQ